MCKVLCLPSTLHSFSLNVSLNFQIELRRLILSRPARPRRPGRGVTPAFWTPDLSPPQRSLCEERGYTASLATKESSFHTPCIRASDQPPTEPRSVKQGLGSQGSPGWLHPQGRILSEQAQTPSPSWATEISPLECGNRNCGTSGLHTALVLIPAKPYCSKLT